MIRARDLPVSIKGSPDGSLDSPECAGCDHAVRRNGGAAEPPQGRPWNRHIIDQASRGADGVRLADANGDGLPDVVTAWEQGGQVRLCLNPGPRDVQKTWPSVRVGAAGDGEDAVLVDLDSDGRLDVLSSSEGKTRSINIHWAPPPDQLLNPDAWITADFPAARDRMMWMYTLPAQIDGRHGIDFFAGGKNQEAAIGWFEAPASARDLEGWKWRPLRQAGWLMSLVSSDMDGDGDQDLVFSDRKGARSGAAWLENPGPGRISETWKEHSIGGQGKQAMFLSLADVDADGLEDVLLAVQPREIHWFRRLNADGRSWEPHSIPLPELTGIAKAVSAGDIDLDGRIDLVFSCEQAKSPAEGLMWLSRNATGRPTDWKAHRLSGADGVKHDLVALLDLDGDGDLDALTTEEVTGLGVIWYENPTR